jgi:hypothetical protein
MSVLDRLSAKPGVYWGEGRGPAGGRFVARIAVQVHDDETVTFDYETWSPAGGLQHAESARIGRTGSHVTLAATSNGGDDTMIFREGEIGVFGSVGEQRVGLVITNAGEDLTFSWWWTGKDGQLREQSRAVVKPMRGVVAAPLVPGHQSPRAPDVARRPVQARRRGHLPERDAEPVPAIPGPSTVTDRALADDVPVERGSAERGSVDRSPMAPFPGPLAELAGSGRDVPPRVPSEPGSQGRRAGRVGTPPPVAPGAGPRSEPGARERSVMTVPWPGILVLHGSGTGLVAQRLAARLTRAAVVRTDLFDRAVRGTAGRPDPALRQRIALSVVQGYAATGHPVILHGSSSRQEHEDLVGAIADAGLSPVQLVEVSEGEDYGEIARRLIDND